MNRSPIRRLRGFTLVELLVSLAISAIVLASLFGVVQSQQTAYFQGHLQRAAQTSARSALAYVEQRLATAGYGMDAPLAFDFQYYGVADPMPCPGLADGCPRDSVSGNDELVFYARNPRYWVPEDRSGAVQPSGNAWRVISVGPGSITLSARTKDRFEKGRILQVLCAGAEKYAYMTVAGNVPATGTLLADNAGLQILLAPSIASNPFRRQDAAAAETCFSDGTARAFLVDRFRFHVRPASAATGGLPYLVLDTGLDTNNDGPDEAEEVVVAEGIESFQVGYVMMNATELTPRGTLPGTKIAFSPGPTGARTGNAMTTLQFPGLVNPGDWLYQGTSWYRYAVGPTPAVADERLTDHQANIRAVRITLVARGSVPDPARRQPESIVPVLNQDKLPAWSPATVPYNRARVETTVAVRNMLARGMNDF